MLPPMRPRPTKPSCISLSVSLFQRVQYGSRLAPFARPFRRESPSEGGPFREEDLFGRKTSFREEDPSGGEPFRRKTLREEDPSGGGPFGRKTSFREEDPSGGGAFGGGAFR